MASIQTILAVAAANNLRVDQLDMESAYLNGEMDTEVYMEQPPGFVDKKLPNYVCRLWKALYGLKQAGNCWNVLVNAYLLELGFTHSLSDSCIYTKNHEGELIIVGLYIDDFIYASKPHINDWFAQQMQKCFSIKILSQATHILGIQIQQTSKGISITQMAYIQHTLEEMGMTDCRPSNLPATERDISIAVKDSGNAELVDSTHFKHIIGKLMYAATGTRPDIAFAIGFLSCYAHDPTTHHLKMVKILLRYLALTATASLFYPTTNGKFEFVTYSDSNWVGASNSHSTTGFVTLVNGTALT
jgi:hypothetical protein